MRIVPLKGLLPFAGLLLLTAPTRAQVLINEVDALTPGFSDLDEFIELYDGGAGGTSLDGLVVVLYTSNFGGRSYAAFDLDGFVTDANGYFLLGNAGVVPTPQIPFPSNFLLNSPTAVALYTDDASSFPVGSPITVVNLDDAIVYDTGAPDNVPLLALLNPGQPQLDESALGNAEAFSNQRCRAGTGGGRNTQYWVQGPPTPAAEPSSIGTNYCNQATNSSGQIGRMLAYGSNFVADNNVTLVACDLPQNEFGYFLVSSAPDFVDLPAALSNGDLCLQTGPDLGRYGSASQLSFSGPEGMISLVIDLDAIPTATGVPPLTAAMPGDTFYFQAWHRDIPGGGAENNFTDGIQIMFL
jgi:hypothetical protein